MKEFVTSWKSSTQPRKQRKYRYNAPLHIKQKFMGSHLSPELRKKHGIRSIPVRKDDKVKILRGQFRGQSGKVERLDIKRCRVYVSKIEIIKKDGTKTMYPINPSNLMIEVLNLDDKKRIKEKNDKKTPKAA
ncbi:MAG: 50S ribosomal protein L24 [archaeon]